MYIGISNPLGGISEFRLSSDLSGANEITLTSPHATDLIRRLFNNENNFTNDVLAI